MKQYKIYLLTILYSLIVQWQQTCISQTYVSGYISTNKTWNKSGSPYIILTDVAIIDSAVLTILPGTIIKFKTGTSIELRDNSGIIINGNVNDSVLFTGDTTKPYSGCYRGLFLNGPLSKVVFNYCNFEYANNAIFLFASKIGSLNPLFNHCRFYKNNQGYYEEGAYNNLNDPLKNTQGTFNYCDFISNTTGVIGVGSFPSKFKVFNSCKFSNNFTGIGPSVMDSIYQCQFIKNNSGIRGLQCGIVSSCYFDSNITAMGSISGSYYPPKYPFNEMIVYQNTIKHCDLGISTMSSGRLIENTFESNGIAVTAINNPVLTISCNSFCNSSNYHLKNLGKFDSPLEAKGNYWCTLDSNMVESKIWDGKDDVKVGLVKYMPIDTQNCYRFVGLNERRTTQPEINFYPNPVMDILSISSPLEQASYTIAIYDLNGVCVTRVSQIGDLKLDMQNLPSAMYFLQIAVDGKIMRKKIIKE